VSDTKINNPPYPYLREITLTRLHTNENKYLTKLAWFMFTSKFSSCGWYFHNNMFMVSELGVMVFNDTINNISVILRRSVLLVEETGEPRENH